MQRMAVASAFTQTDKSSGSSESGARAPAGHVLQIPVRPAGETGRVDASHRQFDPLPTMVPKRRRIAFPLAQDDRLLRPERAVGNRQHGFEQPGPFPGDVLVGMKGDLVEVGQSGDGLVLRRRALVDEAMFAVVAQRLGGQRLCCSISGVDRKHDQPFRRDDPVQFPQPFELQVFVEMGQDGNAVDQVHACVRQRQRRPGSIAQEFRAGAEIVLAPGDRIGIDVRAGQLGAGGEMPQPVSDPSGAAAEVQNSAKGRNRPAGQLQGRHQARGSKKSAGQKSFLTAIRADHMIDQALVVDRRNLRMKLQHAQAFLRQRLLKIAERR